MPVDGDRSLIAGQDLSAHNHTMRRHPKTSSQPQRTWTLIRASSRRGAGIVFAVSAEVVAVGRARKFRRWPRVIRFVARMKLSVVMPLNNEAALPEARSSARSYSRP